MESAVHSAVPLRVGKKMRKRRELDALVGGGGSRSSRLLSASSDEGEPWARRTTRRRRSRPFVRLAAGLALCVCVVSAATVLWLFVDVRRQIVSLRIEMDRVSTSSETVGDTIQLCHTKMKELATNSSEMSFKLAKLEQDHMELVKRVDQATKDLAEISNQLSAAPKLADTPRRLAELQRTVADIGSQINGFEGAVNSAKKQAVTALTGVDEIRTIVHQLEAKTNETITNVTANVKRDEDIKNEIVSLNSTLVSKVDTLQARIQEMNKPVNTVAPMASAPIISNNNTMTNTTIESTAAPTQPPGPPAKPSILQS